MNIDNITVTSRVTGQGSVLWPLIIYRTSVAWTVTNQDFQPPYRTRPDHSWAKHFGHLQQKLVDRKTEFTLDGFPGTNQYYAEGWSFFYGERTHDSGCFVAPDQQSKGLRTNARTTTLWNTCIKCTLLNVFLLSSGFLSITS